MMLCILQWKRVNKYNNNIVQKKLQKKVEIIKFKQFFLEDFPENIISNFPASEIFNININCFVLTIGNIAKISRR